MEHKTEQRAKAAAWAPKKGAVTWTVWLYSPAGWEVQCNHLPIEGRRRHIGSASRVFERGAQHRAHRRHVIFLLCKLVWSFNRSFQTVSPKWSKPMNRRLDVVQRAGLFSSFVPHPSITPYAIWSVRCTQRLTRGYPGVFTKFAFSFSNRCSELPDSPDHVILSTRLPTQWTTPISKLRIAQPPPLTTQHQQQPFQRKFLGAEEHAVFERLFKTGNRKSKMGSEVEWVDDPLLHCSRFAFPPRCCSCGLFVVILCCDCSRDCSCCAWWARAKEAMSTSWWIAPVVCLGINDCCPCTSIYPSYVCV